MQITLRTVAAAALSLLAASSAFASPNLVETEYSVRVRGVPVGRAQFTAELKDGQYKIELKSRTSGLVRIFSDGEGAAAVSGVEADGRLMPSVYGHRWTEDGDTERVQVSFAGENAAEIDVQPPLKRPKRYVPVRDEHKKGVLDPATAFLWPVSGTFGPELCDRVLPLFDGKRRFDLTFAYDRTEQFEAEDGSYSGPAVVCSIRYLPIAGHRRNKKEVQFMADNKDMEIWMAPAGDAGLAAPVMVRVATKYGRVVMEAKRFAAR